MENRALSVIITRTLHRNREFYVPVICQLFEIAAYKDSSIPGFLGDFCCRR